MKKILLIIVVLVIAALGYALFANIGANEKLENETSMTTEPTATESIMMEDETEAIVTLDETNFSPNNLKVKAGTSVKWINKSGKTASVNSDDHPTHQLNSFLNLGDFTNGSALEVLFERPGIYGYHNHRNASQNGTVTVE